MTDLVRPSLPLELPADAVALTVAPTAPRHPRGFGGQRARKSRCDDGNRRRPIPAVTPRR